MQKLPEGIERTIIVLTPPTKAMLDELVKSYNHRLDGMPKMNRSALIRLLIGTEYTRLSACGLVKDVTK